MAGLNPSQHAAVEHLAGPLLVLAGAGSGKTRVVTARIARLLERGVPARAILAVTFTNKAAAEMRERVAKQVGARVAKQVTIATFHGFGLSVLAAEARALGLRDDRFTLFDQGDSLALVRELLRTVDAGRKFDLGAIVARISQAKNHFAHDAEWREREGDDYDEIARMLFPRYQAALRGYQAFDFDDLVCEPVRLWRRRADLLEKWQQRYTYLLVDEYQDTNHAQLELVRALGGAHNNVCVVGDDDQSIYAWRGADVTNILDFERHFPGAKVVKLEDNYRSSASILAVANAVLAASRARRHDKTLVAARPGGDKVRLVLAADADVEADFVAREIAQLRQEGVAARDIAVLYRSNQQSEALEAALAQAAVPVRVVGGQQLFDRKEVKDVLGYLKVLVHPHDEIAVRRVVNFPARGVGDAALERLAVAATARGFSLLGAVERAGEIDGLSPQARDGCAMFASVVSEARGRLATGDSIADTTRWLVSAVGLQGDMRAAAGSNTAFARRWGSIESLFKVFERHDERSGDAKLDRLVDLLRVMMLQRDSDDGPSGDAVTLVTMHGAKGLEWRYVFLVGLEEGLLPHTRAIDARAQDLGGAEANDIEEERRLFYVSITRARDRLYLCRAKSRALRGKPVVRVPSRFLVQIPDELLQPTEVTAVPVATLAEGTSAIAAILASLGK